MKYAPMKCGDSIIWVQCVDDDDVYLESLPDEQEDNDSIRQRDADTLDKD